VPAFRTTPPKAYIARLIRAGFKIAICDQMEQPARAKARSHEKSCASSLRVPPRCRPPRRSRKQFSRVRRQASLGSPIGLAYVDLSTGEFQATEFSGERADDALRDELQLLRPRETLLPRPQQLFETAKTSLLEGVGGVESRLEDWVFPARLCRAHPARTVWRRRNSRVSASTITRKRWLPPRHRSHLRENAARGDRSAPTNENADASGVEALRHLDRVRYYEQHDALVLDPCPSATWSCSLPSSPKTAGRTTGPTTLIAALDATVTAWARASCAPGFYARSSTARPSTPALMPSGTSCNKPSCAANPQGTQRHPRPRAAHQPDHAGACDSARTRGAAQVARTAPVLKNFLTPQPAGGSELLRQLHQEIDEPLTSAIDSNALSPTSRRPGHRSRHDSQRLPRRARRTSSTSASTANRLSPHGKSASAKRTGIRSLKIRFNQSLATILKFRKPTCILPGGL